jgi:hypothetical protein
MNFKPFCIETDGGWSEEKLEQFIDKCVAAGANRHHSAEDMLNSAEDMLNKVYIGVDYDNDTYSYISSPIFGVDAVVIGEEDLDEHLGLGVEDTPADEPLITEQGSLSVTDLILTQTTFYNGHGQLGVESIGIKQVMKIINDLQETTKTDYYLHMCPNTSGSIYEVDGIEQGKDKLWFSAEEIIL